MSAGYLAVAAALTVVAAVRGMWSPCGLSMLSSLNPVAERSRDNRFWLTCVWYVMGAVMGGAVLGGACAFGAWLVGLSPLGAQWTWLLALLAAAVAALSDSRLVPFQLPDHPRQVDERWLTNYRRWIYAGGYGVQIGTGFATYIMSAAVYLVAALAVLSGSPLAALALGVLFGFVRGLGVLLTLSARTPESLRGLLARVDGLGRMSALTAGVACGVVAGVAGAHLGGAMAGAGVAVLLAGAVVTPALTRTRVIDPYPTA